MQTQGPFQTNLVVAENDPLDWIQDWYNLAQAQPAILLPDAATLCTASKKFGANGRVVLFKGIVEGKILFVTNYKSLKGRELAANPKVTLVFYWQGIERQIRIHGKAVKASRKQSDAYWSTRPRESQIGAWASEQSESLPNYETLKMRFDSASAKYGTAPIPRPPHWGGYLIEPFEIEFWQGMDHRLHQRRKFEWVKNKGKKSSQKSNKNSAQKTSWKTSWKTTWLSP